MSHNKSFSLTLIIVTVAVLAGGAGFFAAQSFRPAPPPSTSAIPAPQDKGEGPRDEGRAGGDQAKATDHRDDHAEEKGGHDHGHEAKISDLDQAVDTMWSASCEHNIPQYQCDECRYEIGTVKLDEALVGEHGLVRTGYPEKRAGRQEERTLPGEVQLDETRTVHVASPLTGLITRSFAAPGAQVKAGSPLFEVDSPAVAEAKGSYLKALTGLELARKGAVREALLFSRKVAAEVEVQEAEAKRAEAETEMAAARGRLLRLGLSSPEIEAISARNGAAALSGLVVIRATRAGAVIEGHAAPGEYAETGKELLTISGLEKVWVLADLKESDLAAVSGAAGGVATIDALGQTFTGRLDAIASRMSEETRTAKARFNVDNRGGLLKPGLFVSVRLPLPAAGETLVVPKEAVLADEGRTFVFTHKEGDYWVRRPVTLGQRFGKLVEITAGLTAGQRIISEGSFLLKSDVLRGKMGAGCAD